MSATEANTSTDGAATTKPDMTLQPSLGGPEHKTTSQTTLHIKQKWWKYFKNTGRGFVINDDSDNTMFTVQTNTLGRNRTIEDSKGQPLFTLDRHWTSMKKGWELRGPDQKLVMKVAYNPFKHLHPTLEAEFVNEDINTTSTSTTTTTTEAPVEVTTTIGTSTTPSLMPAIHLRANDMWGGDIKVTFGDDKPMMTMICTNMPPNLLSGYMVVPPKWKAEVVEGTDLVLAAVLAVCVSDAFSEARLFMG